MSTDSTQLAGQIFRRTRRIEAGSAIMNIFGVGGPLVAAEKVANMLAWHGLDPAETRRFRLGFGAGRFEYIARTTGVVPRNEIERMAWTEVKQLWFREAAEIFVRLLQGETLSSDDLPEQRLLPSHFKTEQAYQQVASLAGCGSEGIPIARRWPFELTRLVPDFRPELLQLVAGTHDAELQAYLNRFAPVQVFNLSITPPAVTERTHAMMQQAYHPAGGPWQCKFLPQTVMVFLNADPNLSDLARRAAAQAQAKEVLSGYWRAMTGTVDPAKVADASDNALVGNPQDVAAQLLARYKPDDSLMLWFDFMADSGEQVVQAMEAFSREVIPLVRLGRVNTG